VTRHSRLEVWTECEALGLVPLFYHPSVRTAEQIVSALRAGGAKLIEFTNRGDRAAEVFRQLAASCERVASDVLLGVGSVVEPVTAGIYADLGASFVVGPTFHREIAKLCNRRKIAYFPGCATPSEISAAEEMGAEICKVFPGGEVGGPGFIRAVKGPCPWVKLMPTGGVEATRDSLAAWFAAGAVCVGMGSKLVRADLVDAEDWDALTRLTAQCLAWIREVRASLA